MIPFRGPEESGDARWTGLGFAATFATGNTATTIDKETVDAGKSVALGYAYGSSRPRQKPEHRGGVEAPIPPRRPPAR